MNSEFCYEVKDNGSENNSYTAISLFIVAIDILPFTVDKRASLPASTRKDVTCIYDSCYEVQ